jgi:hypothetical protein
MANVFALVNGRDRKLLFIRSLHQEKVGAGGEKTAADAGALVLCCTVQSFHFSGSRVSESDFFTNIHLCPIKLSKMTPAKFYCHFWPGGSA